MENINHNIKIKGIEKANAWTWLDPILAQEGLEKLIDILYGVGISVWLDCGTLLGIIREKKFIEYAYDVDLGIKIDDVEKVISLREKLKEQNILINLQQYNNIESMVEIFYAHKIKIDLYIWHKIGTNYRKVIWYDNNSKWTFAEVNSKFYDNLDKILFLDKEYFVPRYIEEYLSLLYHNWRVPEIGPSAFNFIIKNGEEFFK